MNAVSMTTCEPVGYQRVHIPGVAEALQGSGLPADRTAFGIAWSAAAAVGKPAPRPRNPVAASVIRRHRTPR